jgi:phage gp36-like protein
LANYIVIPASSPGTANVGTVFNLYVTGVAVPANLQVTPAATGMTFSPGMVSVPSTGVASFTGTAIAAATYSIAFSNNGGLVDPSALSFTVGAGCYFSSQTDLENRWGQQNIATWSDTNGQGFANEQRIQAALTWAQQYINGRFYGAGLWSAQQSANMALGAFGQTLANEWTCVLAGYWLYTSRGLVDKEMEGKIAPAYHRALNEIELNAWSRLGGWDAPERWPQTDGGPIARWPNEFGTAPAPGPG